MKCHLHEAGSVNLDPRDKGGGKLRAQLHGGHYPLESGGVSSPIAPLPQTEGPWLLGGLVHGGLIGINGLPCPALCLSPDIPTGEAAAQDQGLSGPESGRQTPTPVPFPQSGASQGIMGPLLPMHGLLYADVLMHKKIFMQLLIKY